MKKNTQILENDLWMLRNDLKWSNVNKIGSNINEILVKSLDFDGFGRKFPKYCHVAEYLSPRIFRVGQKQNILGVST